MGDIYIFHNYYGGARVIGVVVKYELNFYRTPSPILVGEAWFESLIVIFISWPPGGFS